MSNARLLIIKALVLSLLVTLGGRLYYLQILSGNKYSAAAKDNRIREVSTPAARGAILDDQGRALVRNRTAIVISVSHFDLIAQKDKGKAVINRLAKLIGKDPVELMKTVTPCEGAKPVQPCWNGIPQQPVPVKQYEANDLGERVLLEIEVHKEKYPAVSADLQAVRDYPNKTMAAHILGYLSPIQQEQLKDNVFPGASATDLVGQTGLERVYNSYLAGKNGVKQILVNRNEKQTGVLSDTPATAGDSLVLSIDQGIQKYAEEALQKYVLDSRTRTDRDGRHFNAPAGAAVVLDAKSGRVLAIAGYPTYDPSIFVGGISSKDYAHLISQAAGQPLLDQATGGLYAQGSTFKIVTTSAVVKNGDANFGTYYPCPSQFELGTGKFANFESEALGSINLRTALIKSCDTIFYRFAASEWEADGDTTHVVAHPKEPIANMARSFGLAKKTGIDLPIESTGRIADRAYKKELYDDQKQYYCTKAKSGFPEVKDAAFADYLKRLMVEDCADGYQFKGGEAVIQAVGQGDTVVTPLQLAVAYEALANGGTVKQPLLAKAAISHDGKVVKTFTPKVNGKLPVSGDILSQITSALEGVTSESGGTASGAFAGFPLGQIPVAGKTGTAEVANKQDTSWFASFAPANDPQFVVVGMVAEAGQGALAAAPMVREIYDGIYGLRGKTAAAPNGKLASQLPTVSTDGTVKPPADAPKVTPSHAPNPSSSPSPTTGVAATAGLGLTAILQRIRTRKRRRARADR